jgi:hypothetical protein
LDLAQWQEVAQLLRPKEMELFRRFGRGDQLHSYRVMRWLKVREPADQELLTAALLHDVGKTRVRLSPLERSAAVLAWRLAPALAATWAAGGHDRWRKPFAARLYHPAWGAELAAAAGSSPTVVKLIRYHQAGSGASFSDREARLLRLLQDADDRH